MKTVSTVIKSLMLQEPYYGLFACSLNKEFSNKIPTACVSLDGINFKLQINKEWWDTLSPEDRYGTIKHELLHLVFYHVVDYEQWKTLEPDHDLLNVAMDLEVQSYIDKKYWGDPKKYAAEGIFDKYPALPLGMGTKWYLNFLHSIQKNNPQSSFGNLPEQTIKDIKDILDQVRVKNHTWQEVPSTMSELVKNQMEYQMKEAAQQTLKVRGHFPGEIEEKLKELLKPKPPVFNWKAYFRRLLGTAFDIYSRKTRRKESNRFEDAQGLRKRKKHKLLVGVDTSGSVSQEELQDFFSEITHIWKAGAEVTILEIDADIKKSYPFKGKIPEQVSGRGGTSFLPGIDYFNEHRKEYTCMVYFTDGYGDQDKCKPLGKVLWVITSNGAQDAKFPGPKICIPKKSKN